MKNYKSFGFWTALAGAVTVLVNALGSCFGFSVDNQIVTDVIMSVAGVLVVLGIVTMPKKDKNSTEETKEETETTESDPVTEEVVENTENQETSSENTENQ